MTVSSQTNRKDYAGDGVQTDFSFPYVFFADTDLDVYVTVGGVTTQKTVNSDYTISGTFANGRYASGANVVFAVAPALNSSIAIVRDVPYTQEIDYTPYDSFPAETHETGLDKNTVMAQQLLSLIAGVLRVHPSEAEIGTLPTVNDRASKYLAFDADGDPMASAAAVGSAVSAFIATLIDDADAAAARATLGLDNLGTASTKDTGVIEDTIPLLEAGGKLPAVDGSQLTGINAIPVGTVLPYAGAAAPSGYLMCDGSAVSRATYADLWALLSTTFGDGDGATTFNVPDLKARVPVGVGQGMVTQAFISQANVSDTITTAAAHGLNTGDAVTYRLNGGSAIGGLTDGNTYYVIRDTTTTLRLATSLANAVGTPTVVNITGTVSPAAETNYLEKLSDSYTLGATGGKEKGFVGDHEIGQLRIAGWESGAGAGANAIDIETAGATQGTINTQALADFASVEMNRMPPYLGLNYIIKT